MRSPSRTALRWGAPVALAAAAIAALFVVPVFGGSGTVTQRSLENQVQAFESGIGNAFVGPGTAVKTVGKLRLAPGNYVFTTTYEILRKGPRAGAACELNINGSGPSSATQGPDVAGSVAVPTQQTAAMSSTRHLKHAATAKLQCAGNGNGKATLFNISIIALKFPKLTVHRVLSPKR